MRLVVVSDSHLSPGSPAADRNWDVVVDHVRRSSPDLVVHGGDLASAADRDPEDLDHSRRRLDELAVPWRVVPGNHDVGNPWDARAGRLLANQRFEDIIGERFWSLDAGNDPGDWRLVGVDVQTLVTGHADDECWWSWLAEALDPERRVALFLHRPLMPTSPGERDTDRRYVTEPHRSRLRRLLAEANVGLVASGHVHQWRSETIDGVHTVWVPSTWASIADSFQPVIGTKVVGLVEIELGARSEARLVVPEGMEQTVHGPAASMR